MAGSRPVTTQADVSIDAGALLQQLRAAGFVLEVAAGARLRIRPADRVTPDLRDMLLRRKTELVALLQPTSEYVILRGGLTVPIEALRLVWDLEDRGFQMRVDQQQQIHVEPSAALTTSDRAAIRCWRLHVAAIVAYEPLVIS